MKIKNENRMKYGFCYIVENKSMTCRFFVSEKGYLGFGLSLIDVRDPVRITFSEKI